MQPYQAAILNAFSQLVYLDAVPAMERHGIVTVESLCAYYLDTAVGRDYLRVRFGGNEREYAKWPPFLRNARRSLGAFRIAHALDDNRAYQSGFYGCTYHSPANDTVIAFRGSEMVGDRRHRNDYINNFSLAYSDKTPQQAVVDAYLSGLPAFPGHVYITGHSLGGNLAAYAAITAPSAISARLALCMAFNAPGFPKPFCQAREARARALGERLVLCQNVYDPVSSLLYNITPPLIAMSHFDPGAQKPMRAQDLLYPHSNFMFVFDDHGHIVPTPVQRKSRFCQLVHLLSDLLMRLPKPVIEDLSQLLLSLLYLPSPKEAKRYALAAMLERLTHCDANGGGLCSALEMLLAMFDGARMPALSALYSKMEQSDDLSEVEAMSLCLAAMTDIA